MKETKWTYCCNFGTHDPRVMCVKNTIYVFLMSSSPRYALRILGCLALLQKKHTILHQATYTFTFFNIISCQNNPCYQSQAEEIELTKCFGTCYLFKVHLSIYPCYYTAATALFYFFKRNIKKLEKKTRIL